MTNKLNRENIISYISKLGEVGDDLCFPRNWSCNLFIKDIEKYPPQSLTEMALNVKHGGDYRIFFHKTRGYPHPLSIKDERIWNIFGSGSIMIYFENTFIYLLYKEFLSIEDVTIMRVIENLSKILVIQWDAYLSNIGCCCYEFFVKEPYSYVSVIDKLNKVVVNDPSNPGGLTDMNNITDFEMLAILNLKLLDVSMSGKISRSDSRTRLTDMVKEHLNKVGRNKS